MTAQLGQDLRVRIGTIAANPVGDSYVTLGGIRSSTITRNKEIVDVTNKDSAGNRALLGGAGIKSTTISGSGVFTDTTSETTIVSAYDSNTLYNYEIVVPDFGTFRGKFEVSSLEYGGEHNGEVTYSLTLESSGEITFTAAP